MIDNSILFPQPIQAPVKPNQTANKPAAKGTGSGTPFAQVLDQKLPGQPVKLSQHAQERLKSRGITLSDADMKQLEGAVDSVAQKGGRESLILMGDAALVVSVKNRTVVTAMDRQGMKGNVFTNIDSAVFF
ncbi:TIGR02530 family flagellar biosynthesis protein [Geomonas subterranea]|uniref:Flagellar protein n=1 Tax=Geomonas subterranea TaxID=2847989 RepID=A0ABX8LF24_9BACT|nr:MULTISPECIES: TIGR02530 family flagellar biosynthesis protein [Geomonas]QXE90272.1 flagellar protein [Geomonas subterranea]QXM07603.1 flagellar protein [Geomonas subterranea]